MSEATEKRYTLTEAAAELRKAECTRFGHNWEVVAYGTLGTGAGGTSPIRIYCDRCGWSGGVTMGERP